MKTSRHRALTGILYIVCWIVAVVSPTPAHTCFTLALGSVHAGCYTQDPHRSTIYKQSSPNRLLLSVVALLILRLRSSPMGLSELSEPRRRRDVRRRPL